MISLQIVLALRYLWGRKLRTFLTTLAIVFGTLVIFATNLLLPTMIEAFQRNTLAASGQVDVTVTLKTGEAFPRSVISRLRYIDGVKYISGSISRTINLPADYSKNDPVGALTLTGIDTQESQQLRSYRVKEGRFLRSTDTQSAVITTSLAESLGLKLGDRLYLPTTEGGVKLRIVGLLAPRAMPGNEEVLVTLTEAQKLLNLPKRINTIEINLNTTDENRRQVIQQAIERELGEDYTLGGLSGGGEMMTSLQMGQTAFNFIGFLALFMGGFIIFNTFRTVVAERRHDIGMLRAIGASRKTIVGTMLVEGILQGTIGSAVGIGIGYLLGALSISYLGTMVTAYIPIQLGAPVIEPGLIGITLFLGVGMTLVAGLLPAISAGRVTPLEALRPAAQESSPHASRTSAVIGAVLIVLAIAALLSGRIEFISLGSLLFMAGLVLAAPALVKPIANLFSALIATLFARDGTGVMANNNLSRQPSRSAVTASATMIGLAIIVGLGGMIWSLSGGFIGMLERSLGSDYLLMPPSVAIWNTNIGAKGDLGDRLSSIPGIEAVSSMRYAAGDIDGSTVSILSIDPQVYPKVASLTFQSGSSQAAFEQLAQGRAVILNGILAAQLGVKPGSTVRISTPTGLRDYTVAAIAGDYLNAKIQTAYISHQNIETDFRKKEDILFQINLQNGADAARVEQKMSEILKDYPQFKLISGKNYIEENKQLFSAVFVFYFVLLALLSTPSLIALLNTLAIGVIERTHEIGMLRAVGATQRQVRRLVVIESLLLAGIGTVFGVAAGLYLGYVMVLALSSGGFPVEYVFPYYGVLGAVITGLLFGLLAALLPASQAARMEIVRALRYE